MASQLVLQTTSPDACPRDLVAWLDVLEAMEGHAPPGWKVSGASGASGLADSADNGLIARVLAESGPVARRLAVAVLDMMKDVQVDADDVVFVNSPLGDADSPASMRTYETDCLRSATCVHRARSGRTGMRVVLLDACEDERMPGRHGDMFDLLGWDAETKVMRVKHTSDAVRLACMAMSPIGGVLSYTDDGSVDAVGLWALRTSWHLQRMREQAQGQAGGPDHGEVRGYVPYAQLGAYRRRLPAGSGVRMIGWRGEGDAMAAEPMLDAMRERGQLDAARANLAGCPPVVWINLDRQDGRRRDLEMQMDALGVRWHRRLRAVDGWDAAQLERRVVRRHPSGTPAENACTASHLLAIARYLREFPDSPWAIVLEDDVSFELAHLWHMPLRAYLELADAEHPGWRVMQLGPIACDKGDLEWPSPAMSPDRAGPRLRDNWFGTVGYAITRKAAEDYVGWYVRSAAAPERPVIGQGTGYGTGFDVDGKANNLNSNPRAARQEPDVVDLGELVHEGCTCVHAEKILFSFGDAGSADAPTTLTLPLLSFAGSDSDINQCNPFCHSIARGYLLRFWAQAPPAVRPTQK